MTTQSLTRNQGLVFDVLSHAGSPLSAYSILDKLRDDGFRAPLQVYRALDKLLEFGLSCTGSKASMPSLPARTRMRAVTPMALRPSRSARPAVR